jgi:hypothetical protein
LNKKNNLRSKLILPIGLILVTVLASSIYFINLGSDSEDFITAAIIDGLIDFPGELFINNASEILENAGYRVEVFKPDDITVELYEKLPSQRFDIIILRVHCGPLNDVLADGTKIPRGTVFFTTEEYDEKKYRAYQEKNLLAIGNIRGKPGKSYFTIPPWFFEHAAPGSFDNSTIILDSCYGFYFEAPLVMADTLIMKGVREFIGWNGEVQAHHTDKAVIELLKAILDENLPSKDAVEKVRDIVGPDPFYKSQLYYYPY